ncbi:uncharacterized protein BDV17DRAFT_289887 [Aspergillus undulatus]|uniref:uncharacterized protein n=1 Tax=Aspergillus undulatus TaxID=1810928 RepID=UPI003CCE2B5E
MAKCYGADEEEREENPGGDRTIYPPINLRRRTIAALSGFGEDKRDPKKGQIGDWNIKAPRNTAHMILTARTEGRLECLRTEVMVKRVMYHVVLLSPSYKSRYPSCIVDAFLKTGESSLESSSDQDEDSPKDYSSGDDISEVDSSAVDSSEDDSFDEENSSPGSDSSDSGGSEGSAAALFRHATPPARYSPPPPPAYGSLFAVHGSSQR